jgi:hypothetical protein
MAWSSQPVSWKKSSDYREKERLPVILVALFRVGLDAFPGFRAAIDKYGAVHLNVELLALMKGARD